MMEFEDEHEEEEEEEEEEEDSELAITPTFKKHPHQPPSATARYRECLKNHAVGIGGHAVDGCGEFMPAGADGSLDALRCAACNCHRNFHRKELIFDSNNIIATTSSSFNQQLTLYTPRPHTGAPPPPHHHHHPQQIYQFYPYSRTTTAGGGGSGGGGGYHISRPLALPSPTTTTTPSPGGGIHRNGEEGTAVVGGGGGLMLSPGSGSSGRKRFRTKFSQEQKDKMLCLAEKLGWKIQKQDENVVQQFCQETGVKRHVLKVWMHNNKHTLGKKP